MNPVTILIAYNRKAEETKKQLTKSYFLGDKSFYNETLAKYPFAKMEGNIYETINNLSAKVAQNFEY